MKKMNIAFCFNSAYTDKIAVTMVSILKNNPNTEIDFYLFSSDLTEKDIAKLDKLHIQYKEFNLHLINVDKELFKDLKLNIPYISVETYYRYLIADLLPNVDKILYLDGDLIVNKDISSFYHTDLGDCYFAGVTDLWVEKTNHKKDLGLQKYVNAGVLLMNLAKFRDDNLSQQLIAKTALLWDKIKYQDQDILNIVCQDKILLVEDIYNFTMEHIKNDKSKAKKAYIIHYTGQKKPWGDKKVRFKSLWQKYEKAMKKIVNKKIKVGLLIDEFFGGAGTAFGGYGFLARKYIAKYIPDENIQIDVLLGRGKRKLFATKYHVDDVDLYKLPKFHFASRWWLKKQKYDIYLSIELTSDWVLRHETNPNKKLILWIQDPRPKSAWDNIIDTMQSIKDPSFFSPKIYQTVHDWAIKNRVKFISQGNSLNPLALELYNLPKETAIQYLPNPIDLDFDYQFDISKKKKQIIFLGRLEAQKRCWLFCEIAKRMPEYEFYVLGQFFRYQDDNKKMLEPYMNGDIPNLHFVGHVDGEKKKELIKESRILLSTAIWEGIPISWLEALSYGTILVSALERENLANQFGAYVGEILGDGFEDINKFIPAIQELMENDSLYIEKVTSSIQYIRKTHNISRFKKDLTQVIYEVI